MQSSVAGGTSGLVIDGNPTPVIGTCSITAQEAYPWWQVDLGSVERVAMVVIINRGDCCRECGGPFKPKYIMCNIDLHMSPFLVSP